VMLEFDGIRSAHESAFLLVADALPVVGQVGEDRGIGGVHDVGGVHKCAAARQEQEDEKPRGQ